MRELSEAYLTGVCDLDINGQKLRHVVCSFDSADLTLKVQVGNRLHPDPLLGLDAEVKITNVRLTTPFGVAFASELREPLARASRSGNISIDDTDLVTIIEARTSFPTMQFVFNAPPKFCISGMADEWLFSPGLDCGKPVSATKIGTFHGRKSSISIFPQGDLDRRVLQVAVGVVAGSPASLVARVQSGTISFGENISRSLQPKPLVFLGYPYRDGRLCETEIPNLLSQVYEYQKKLQGDERRRFQGALEVYLEGRAGNFGYIAKLLSAFNFLEWLDGTRSMSDHGIASCLELTRVEGKAIREIRNAVVHQGVELTSVIAHEYREIAKTESTLYRSTRRESEQLGFLNYLYTCLGHALLRLVGYNGVAQNYIPTHEDAAV